MSAVRRQISLRFRTRRRRVLQSANARSSCRSPSNSTVRRHRRHPLRRRARAMRAAPTRAIGARDRSTARASTVRPRAHTRAWTCAAHRVARVRRRRLDRATHRPRDSRGILTRDSTIQVDSPRLGVWASNRRREVVTRVARAQRAPSAESAREELVAFVCGLDATSIGRCADTARLITVASSTSLGVPRSAFGRFNPDLSVGSSGVTPHDDQKRSRARDGSLRGELSGSLARTYSPGRRVERAGAHRYTDFRAVRAKDRRAREVDAKKWSYVAFRARRRARAEGSRG